jgi:hypothetical protein
MWPLRRLAGAWLLLRYVFVALVFKPRTTNAAWAQQTSGCRTGCLGGLASFWHGAGTSMCVECCQLMVAVEQQYAAVPKLKRGLSAESVQLWCVLEYLVVAYSCVQGQHHSVIYHRG